MFDMKETLLLLSKLLLYFLLKATCTDFVSNCTPVMFISKALLEKDLNVQVKLRPTPGLI